MTEIRIEKVYDGHIGHTTFVNLRQVGKGTVEYTEDFYPSKNSRPIKSEPTMITSAKANEIFKELKKTATPYIRYNIDEIFERMK